MNAAPRILIRTTGALAVAAISCSLLVSAAPRIPAAVSPASFRTAATLGADRAAVAQVALVAASVASDRISEQRLATRKAATALAATHAAASHAAAARAAASRAAASRASHAAVTPAGVIRTIKVWTSGGQAAINACRGAVDLTRMYGVAVVAEHWRCGGASFPTAPGSTVVLTGLRAGKYRVLGIVATLNAYTQNAGAVPRRYQLLFQTCYGGDSHRTEFIALQKQ
ncbi:MAG TPA: hypothetical protein VGM94_18860 [Galbitalea sp.]|jgi:hypothetical protein